ncbi:hypothetical protein KBC70_04400 [Candidatus Woesebacteria bacterium]|nr:hypothetical protein [Candidatus Woesebacteria bacterium]
MPINPSLHSHAAERIEERFGLDKYWLLQELENGRFVWLKGAGDSGDAKKIRSGHLIYIPDRDDYCIVIMDDRSRLAITVLTVDMALNSSWAKGINEAAKLKAKRIALGTDEVNDSNFLRLYAEERGELSVKVRARTFSHNWDSIVLTLFKTNIVADQIDTEENHCTLTDFQMEEVSISMENRVRNMEMRPYFELFVVTGRGKSAVVSNEIDDIYSFEKAEQARRWNSA